jgi:hypothetical protein
MASDNIDMYGVVAGNLIDLNSGTSKITGDVGSYSAMTGSGSMNQSGVVYTGISINDLLLNASYLYSLFIGSTPDTLTSAPDIGGMTFYPGINALTNFGVSIGGAVPQVTLDGNGIYIFQVPNGNLTTDPTFDQVYFNFLNGAVASDVYWIVSGDMNIQTISGNVTKFAGTVLCQGNITIDVDSTCTCGLIAFSSSPNGVVTLNQNKIVSRFFRSMLDQGVVNGYINMESTLSDNQAIQINASNINGGILLDAGFGGVVVNTTNAISMNASAGSNLSTTLGNILIQSEPALVSLDGGAGLDIGCDNNLANTITPIVTPIINIGTSSSSKTINVGNTTGTSAVTVSSGSGNISLNSNSGQVHIVGNNSSSDAIKLDASSGTNGITVLSGSGGVAVNSGTGKTQIVSTNTNVDAIRLDSSGSSGGISLAAGSSGINIGNDGIDHPIVIGNTTGATNVIIQSGSWGINIGGDVGGGEIHIGDSSVGKTIVVGNDNSGSRLITRWNSVHIKHQENHIALYDNDINPLSTVNLFPGILAGPVGWHLTADRILTLDTAANVITDFGGSAVNGDSIDFTIINTSDNFSGVYKFSIVVGSGGTMIGNPDINPVSNTTNYTGTSTFRLVIDVTNTLYTVYRIT